MGSISDAPKDEDKALKYFPLAVEQGDAEAMNRYEAEGAKHIYNAIYFCKNFLD